MPEELSDQITDLYKSCNAIYRTIIYRENEKERKPYDFVLQTEELFTMLSDSMTWLEDSQEPTRTRYTEALGDCIEYAADLHTCSADLAKRRSMHARRGGGIPDEGSDGLRLSS
ncbi:hypothetical protein EJ06DRAFT_529153 [Trichodelitschia bisporula]|uniref:Uncharacterized protein n=1 Tax=Trichodelitschia bisporula TaxID=703511 RepID=A0A6G1I1G4_9PEZI|nr:hypothetical protein EJ06DRAFT_529153 [Trichodelitschia bisporula]